MKSFEEMSFKELVDYWTGYLTLSIGAGKFREGVSLLLQTILKQGYDKGQRDLKNMDKNNG